MKITKLLFLFVMSLFLVGTSSVMGADISIVDVSGPFTGNPLETTTLSFTIGNQNAVSPRTLVITSTELINSADNTYKISVPAFQSVTIPASGQQVVNVELSIPSVLAGSYTATLTAQDTSDATNKDTAGYQLMVNAVSKVDVTGLDGGKIKFSGSEDTELVYEFTIKNTGSVSYSPSLTISGDFIDSDENEILFDYISNGLIKPNQVKTITLNAVVPDGIELGVYTGSVKIGTNDLNVFKDVPLEMTVEPEVCSDGRVSDENSISGPDTGNIRLTIDQPDNGDDFKINDELDIQVEVSNENDDDMDIVVEAFLYNLDQDEEVARVELDSEEVKEGKSQDFDLTLEIPSDEDLDDGDTYILYVMAYEDGDDDINCNYDNVELNLERNKHDTVVDEFIITPSMASCGDTVSIKVGVQNIGTSDEENVYIRLLSPSLGIDQQSSPFDLDEFDGNDVDMTKTFNFLTPKSVSNGEYNIEAIVYYYGGKETQSKFATLKLSSCSTSGAVGSVTINTPVSSFDAKAGSVVTIPFTVKNNDASSKTYMIEVAASGWGKTVTQAATLSAGQEATTYAYVEVNSGASGNNVATISVRDGAYLLASKTVNVNVEKTSDPTGATTFKPTTTLSSLWRNLSNSTTALIVGVLILVALILILVVLLRRR